MKSSALPSVYQICRLTAILCGKEAVKNPKHAVKVTLALWSAATHELSLAAREHPGGGEKVETGSKHLLSSSPAEMSAWIDADLTDDNWDQVLTCINKMTSHTPLGLKSVRGLKAAWRKFPSLPAPRFGISEEICRQFLELHRGLRRTKDAARKRKARQK